MSQQGPYLEEVPLKTDDLLVLPDDASTEIISDFTEFWTLKAQFQARGFLHKRGILMWGPPGSGKTSTVQQIIQKVIHDLGGIVLMVQNPGVAVECLKMVRKIEPDRPIITVMEDLDSLISKYDESGFLSMLDGEAQVDNILSLATTNYPERLDPRFIDRPSRFDVVRKIDYPSDEARKFYLCHKEPSLTEEELTNWVAQSKGLTIPHLKEMIISVKCYNRDLDETIRRLKKMHTKKFKDGQPGLGFVGSDAEGAKPAR
jgi:AAA+ superfamily predicted ATPase